MVKASGTLFILPDVPITVLVATTRRAGIRGYHLTVAVYDAGGNLLFPLSEDSSGLYSYYDRKDSGLTNFYNPSSRQQEYACYSEMAYSDFTVVTAVVQSEFLAPVYRSLIWTVFVFFLLFLLCLFCSSLLSRKLSNPFQCNCWSASGKNI